MSTNYHKDAIELIWKLPKSTPFDFIQKFAEYVIHGEWELGASTLAHSLCEDNDFTISKSCYESFEELLNSSSESDALQVLKVEEE